ncbi:hypothetical protein WJX74_003704 [Apatococcus lobatus]|uniref:Ketoreductase domain-containing protein n=1 Tax=Apatococcus lobatus TaxID=904363 RepID=A0AAW1Q1Z5_9CHLO
MSRNAFITGAGAGIGREIAARLGRAGWRVTIADMSPATAESAAAEVKAQGGSAQAVPCDVLDSAQQAAALDQHLKAYGSLEAVCLNAGIFESGPFLDLNNTAWQKTLDLDFTAVLEGTRLAAAAMEKSSSKGTIMLMASAGAFYPAPFCPVYCAAKAGLVTFVRSAAEPLSEKNIRLLGLCPGLISTALGKAIPAVDDFMAGRSMQWLTAKRAAEAAQMLIEGDLEPGALMMLHQTGEIFEVLEQEPSLRLIQRAPSPAEVEDSMVQDAENSQHTLPEAAGGASKS